VAESGNRDRPLRLAVLIDGDLAGSEQVATKHGVFVRTLQSHADITGIGDMTLHGLARLGCAALAWRPRPQEWRRHYRVNPLTFTMRSRQSYAWVLGQPARPDVVLQVGALSRPVPSPPPIPYALYLDFTFALTSREWPARTPMLPFERTIWRRLEGQTYADAAAIFIRSHYAARSLCDDYGVPEEKVHVVGAGVNLPLPDLDHLPERAAPRVLYIGSDFRRKGGDLLLEAWPLVRRAVPEAQLTIFGRPTGRLPAGVIVKDNMWDRGAVVQAFEQASVFTMPSRCETWGDVFPEAMAYGLPCVGTAVDAMPEIIVDGETGYLVSPLDHQALAEHLVTLLRDRELARRMGAAGRARVQERFLWDQVVGRMMAILQGCVPAGVTSSP
jgi:glycosyltransferase involved in cell wall biosynthesis